MILYFVNRKLHNRRNCVAFLPHNPTAFQLATRILSPHIWHLMTLYWFHLFRCYSFYLFVCESFICEWYVSEFWRGLFKMFTNFSWDNFLYRI